MTRRTTSMGITFGVLVAGCLAGPAYGANLVEIQKLLASDGAVDDQFGRMVVVDGNTAVVGAFAGDGNAADSGSAYVFTRNEAGTWTELQELSAGDGADGDRFGRSVDLDGDTIVVGAFFDVIGNVRTGSAYVFTRDTDGVWNQQQKLTAGDGDANDRFGHAVAVDGDTVMVAARAGDSIGTDDVGSVYVFSRSNDTWTQDQELIADDASSGDRFGNSLALDGDTLLVGANGDADKGAGSGAAYFFTSSPQGEWSESQKVTANDGSADDAFGHFVALNDDTAIVGAILGDSTATDSGAAYVFDRDESQEWIAGQKLTASDSLADDGFGHSISLDANVVVIGAPDGSDSSGATGAAYLFSRSGLTWTERDKLTASDGAAGDRFGHSVSMDGTQVMISANQDDDSGLGSGSVFVLSPPFAEVVDIADDTIGDADAAVTMRNASSNLNETRTYDGANGNLVGSRTFGNAGFLLRASTSVPDANGDTIDETAAVAVDAGGVVRSFVVDTVTQALLRTLTYPSLYDPIDLVAATSTESGAARQAVGLLGVDPDGASTLSFKDALNNTFVCDLVKFGKVFRSRGARVLDLPAGTDIQKVAVLGVNPNDRRVRVNIRDACNLADSVNVFFNKNFPPVDFQVVPDLNNNGFDEIAVLGKKASGEVQVIIKDSGTKALVGKYAFSANFVPIALVVLDDATPLVGVLGRRADGLTRVTLKRAIDGVAPARAVVQFQSAYTPRSITAVADSNGNGAAELAVVGFDQSGQAHLEIKDSSSANTLVDKDIP